MNLDSITLILVVLNTILSLWTIRVVTLALERVGGQLLTSIHEKIDSVLSGSLGDFEPPNPIQQAIAQMLTQRVQNAPIEQVRGEDGKFSTEKIS